MMKASKQIIDVLNRLINSQKFLYDGLLEVIYLVSVEGDLNMKFDLQCGELSMDSFDLEVIRFVREQMQTLQARSSNTHEPIVYRQLWIYLEPIHNGKNNEYYMFCLTNQKEHRYLLQMLMMLAELLSTKLLTYRSVEADFLVSDIQRQLCENFSDGYMTINREGTVMYLNQNGAKILDLKVDLITGKSLVDFLKFPIDLMEPLRTQKSKVNQDMYVKTLKGRMHLSLTIVPLLSDYEEGLGILLIFNEVKNVRKKLNDLVGANATFHFDQILHQSKAMAHVIKLAKMSAQNESNILIQSESGTGKEMIAQAIHNHSSRSKGPFIAIDCSAIPRELVESELFGYVEGAFTGANRGGRIGKFELANGGTVFLDEIGEMPLEMQSRLLRVIQNRHVMRVGSNEQIPIDIRIISATNRNLEEEVSKQNFRLDLYYRLNVIQLEIPSLRNRNGDIPLLIHAFADKAAKRENKQLSLIDPAVIDVLETYSWPGNVRELENVIERAVVLSDKEITLEHLPERITNNSTLIETKVNDRVINSAIPPQYRSLKAVEKEAILDAISSSDGNITLAAKKLDISRTTLYNKLRQANIQLHTVVSPIKK